MGKVQRKRDDMVSVVESRRSLRLSSITWPGLKADAKSILSASARGPESSVNNM